MNRTDSPAKQPKPFGINGPREPILANTPAGDNTASYDSGFPPITMTLKSAGGLPPKGQDMNQILYELSALCRWFSAGAYNSFDPEFSISIGGYPKGSAVISDDNSKIYLSTIDANNNNPNSVSTGWAELLSFLGGAPLNNPSFTGTPTVPNASQTQIDFRIANTAFVAQAIAELKGGAPDELNTLKKIATSINNDPDVYGTLNSRIGTKASSSDFAYSTTATTIVGSQPGGLKFMCGTVTLPTDSNGNVFVTLPDSFLNSVIYTEANQNKSSYTADTEPFIFSSYPVSGGPVSSISFAVRNTKTGAPLINSAIAFTYFARGY